MARSPECGRPCRFIAACVFHAQTRSVNCICNSRLLPTNQIVNCDGRVRPGGRTLFLWKLMLFRMQRAGHFCGLPMQWSHTRPALQILHGPRSSASHRSFSTCPAVHLLILSARRRLPEVQRPFPPRSNSKAGIPFCAAQLYKPFRAVEQTRMETERACAALRVSCSNFCPAPQGKNTNGASSSFQSPP